MKIKQPIDARGLRRKRYPAAGEQLDAIIKGFACLQKQGVDIGPEMTELIEQVRGIKARYQNPKTSA